MKTLVAVTETGELCCLTPLYAIESEEQIAGISGYSVILVNEESPLAYVLDAGDELNKQFSGKGPTLLAAHILEKHVEMLGEL